MKGFRERRPLAGTAAWAILALSGLLSAAAIFFAANDPPEPVGQVVMVMLILAIYADETPVGFLMSAYWEERQQHWIFRLMIAAEHQGRGYGRAAMRLLIERMRAIPGCRQIYISYEPDNEVARGLYASLGFVVTGEMVGEEEVACLELT